MKMTVLAVAGLLASVLPVAAADITTKRNVQLPAIAVAYPSYNHYVGLNLGTNVNGRSTISTGAVVGTRLHPNFGVEGTYDYSYGYNTRASSHQVFINAVPQYAIPNTAFTVYGLAGVGYGWNDRPVKDGALWNAGVGVKAALTSTIDLDLRYRHIDSFDRDRFSPRAEDRVTLGVNYKF